MTAAAVGRSAPAPGSAQEVPSAPSQDQDQLAIELRDVRLSLGGIDILNDVHFTVRFGEVVGLMGPNGAGKSSLLNVLNGLYRPQSGQRCVLGSRIGRARPDQLALRGVARSLQNVEGFMQFRVRDLVGLGAQVAEPRMLANAWRVRQLRRSDRVSSEEVMERLGILSVADQLLSDLPYGLAKLADLGRVMAARPRLLLLDEPASGLSAAERQHLTEVLTTLCQSTDVTLVLIEHDASLIAGICHRLVVMESGAVLADGPTQEVLDDPRVGEVLLGMGGRMDEVAV